MRHPYNTKLASQT